MADPLVMSQLKYRGYKSITFQLVLLAFVTSTSLLVLGYIDATVWQATGFGCLTAYVARDGISKAAEAFVMRSIGGPSVQTPTIGG